MAKLSVGVGRTFEAVCLFVCLFVRSIKNDTKVFKPGVGDALGYTRCDMVLGFRGQRSRSQSQ